MANYNANDRSEKILQGKRFTTSDLSVSQEAFTSVLDLSAYEIRTDDGLIPSASNQLPFSGSSQNGLIVSASSVDPGNFTEGSADDLPILKYFYRHRLKRGGAAQSPEEQVYYFTEQEATTSGGGRFVSDNQLLESDQLGDFISAKYLVNSGDTVNNAETLTPGSAGYNVVVYVSDSTTASGITEDPSDANNYVFDYKTGVLSWKTGFVPADSKHVYITAYRYIGRTLRSQIDDGTLGGSGFPFSGSAVITGSLTVSASKVDFTNATAISGSTFSGSFVGDGSGLTGLTVDANTVNLGGVLGGTADAATFTNAVVSGSGADNQVAIFNGGTSNIDGSSNLTFDGQTLTVSTASITTNLTVGGNLTVQGTTTTVNSTEVELGDRILVLNAALAGGPGNAGINVHVSASDGDPAAHTGSFLWDDNEQYWKGGILGSEVKFLRETGDGVLSGSAQIKDDISGSFAAPSASFSTRVTANEGNISTNSTNITNLQTDSGSFSTRVTTNETNITNLQTDSGSFSTRVTANEGNISTNSTNITNLQTDSGSFSTRVTTNEGNISTNSTNITNLQTDSGSFSTRVTSNETNITNLQTDSGSFSTRVTTNESNISTNSTNITDLQTDSGSFSTRVTTNETNITNLQTDSGSFSTRVTANEGNISTNSTSITNLQTDSGSFSTRVTANESAISALQGNEVHTAAAISGAINAATASLFNGTPADNQIAVFTDHNTVEGSTFLTFDSSTKTLTVATASITTNLTVGGDLTVSGTTTTVNSTTVEIGDNIIVLNSANAAADAGIHVIDNNSPGITGSLVYNYTSNYWMAGEESSEKRIALFNAANPTNSGFIHLNDSDEIVSVASGSEVGAFLQKTATGFEVSNIIDGGTY